MAATNENYLGASGEDAVSSILLRRGYNIAPPRLDEGIDLFVSDSKKDVIYGAQVKTSLAETSGQKLVGHYVLSKEQLKRSNYFELFYVFVLVEQRFTFVVIPRKELFLMRLRFEQSSTREAKSSELNLRLFFEPSGEASGWGQSFSSYLGFERFFPQQDHSAR